MRVLLLGLLLASAPDLRSQEEVILPVRISEAYNSGPYLIFNCQNQHWVCVTEDNFKECQSERIEDIALARARSSCAPVKRFVTERSCFERQLYLISQNYGDRICVLDEWRQKEI